MIVDEAGQATESESLLPLALLARSRGQVGVACDLVGVARDLVGVACDM